MYCRSAVSIVLLIVFCGCSGNEAENIIPNVVKKVKKAAAPEEIKEKVVESFMKVTSSAAVKLETETDFTSCFVSFAKMKDRKNVLVISSHKITDDIEAPAFYIHAQVELDSLEMLLEQEVSAKMFVQEYEDGGIWTNDSLSPVTLLLRKVNGQFAARISGGQLQNTISGITKDVTGQFFCIEP